MSGRKRVVISLWLAVTLAMVTDAPAAGMVDRKPQKDDPAQRPAANLAEVKRIFVAPLTGGPGADELRDLIIASLTESKQFLITENEEKADAVLKGAADDKVFTDTFDSQEGVTAHGNAGISSGTSSYGSRAKGIYNGIGGSQSESTHIKERKHEAYAAIRLVNCDGEVIWSTTQESNGAKFRGAGAEVAAKVAKQLTLDLDRSRHPGPNQTPAGQAASPSVNAKQ